VLGNSVRMDSEQKRVSSKPGIGPSCTAISRFVLNYI
jgi:hypothetical protein